MASITVKSGLKADFNFTRLILIGKQKFLKTLSYSGPLGDKLRKFSVQDSVFNEALKRLQPNSVLPLYFNTIKIFSVSDEVSRYNCPANSHFILKQLSGIKAENDSEELNIVLYSEYSQVLASFSAIARCFHLYSKKTSATKTFKNVIVEIVLVNDSKKLADADIKFLNDIGNSIQNTCKLIDMPPNELHSERFAEEAIAFVKKMNKSTVDYVLIKGDDLKEKGFGGIYHVGKAACNPPIFLCFSHKPTGATENYALVGKGIVFDTGGMQIKPKNAMTTMKQDMGGAAAVLGAFNTLVCAGFQQNLHCLLCIAENNISPFANKPDDIITLLSGKTIEISNTDAEGRLVLADGVFYAKTTLKAKTIIDVATLTGAQRYASGKIHAAIVANNEETEKQCFLAGRHSGDLVHPLPFAPELHFHDLKSEMADFKNNNNDPNRMDGPPSAVAGLFIGAQIDYGKENDKYNTHWLHIDIAAPASNGERATGFGVSLLCSLLSKHIEANVAKY